MPSKRETTTKSGEVTVSYIVYYKTEEGKRTSRAFSQKAKAIAFERVCKGQPKKQSARTMARGHATLRSIAEDYISEGIIGIDGGDPWRSNTIINTQRRLKKLGEFIDLDTPLRIITSHTMKSLRRDIQGSDIARSTQVSLWGFVKAVFKFAALEGIISNDPTHGLMLRRSRRVGVGEEKVEAYTKKEVEALVRTAQALSVSSNLKKRRAHQFTWLIAPLLFETGMRISELLALEWNNVDLVDGVLHIRQSFGRGDKDLQEVKALASHRSLVISSGMIEELKTLKERGTKFLFETYNRTPLSYHNALHWWYRLQDAAGVKRGGFHKARHYYASRLIEAGVNAKVLTTNLGHADVAFTLQVYGHLFDDRDTRDSKRQLAEDLSTLSL
jgi:integrase